MSDDLASRYRALRLSMFAIMTTLTHDSSDAEFRRAERRWYYYKRNVTETATEPGDARRLIAETFEDLAWQNFSTIRQWRWKQSEKFKARKKAYDGKRYETKLKAQRSSPEYRERARLRRQAARRAAREESSS